MRKGARIARCRAGQDVAAAVAFAREHDLEIAVRSGGHRIPGHSVVDGGMMIDHSQMKAIAIKSRGSGLLCLAAQTFRFSFTDPALGSIATVTLRPSISR
jgi:FAD/FMN-containing dehydrogenase